jgi:pimeloyl-ACP methyl ester carboxylesterase
MPVMPTIELDARRRVSYQQAGQGSAIVLVHGSPGTSASWGGVVKRLADRFRVVALDLPGHGGTTPRPEGEPPTTAGGAEAVEAVIAAVTAEAPGPVVLAGHSYGGIVSLAVALRGRAPLRGLVLLEPVIVKLLPALGLHADFAAVEANFRPYFEGAARGEAEVATGVMIDFWFGAGAYAQMPAAARGFLAAGIERGSLDVRSVFAETYAPERLASLAPPVAVAYGSRSPAITRRMALLLAGTVGRGAAHEIADAGHGMPTTHPEPVAALIAACAERWSATPARA